MIATRSKAGAGGVAGFWRSRLYSISFGGFQDVSGKPQPIYLGRFVGRCCLLATLGRRGFAAYKSHEPATELTQK